MAASNGQSEKDAYLAKLRAQVDRLQALIAAVESEGEGLDLGSFTTGNSRAATDSTVRSDSFFSMTTPQATRRFLEMMGKGNPQSPLSIVDALIRGGMDRIENRDTVVKNVYTALKRGKKNQELVKIQKLWGLMEWYPNHKPTEEKPTKKKRKKAKTATKAPAVTPPPPPAAPKKGFEAFNEFIKARVAAGKTRAEANAEWKKQKPGVS